jgi:hypothetical protein
MNKIAICITAGEQSDNHAGMQINGNGLSNNGFSIDDLRKIKYLLDEKNIENEMIILNNYLDDDNRKDSDEAAIIVIKNGVKKISDVEPNEFLSEQIKLEWDKKYWDTRRKKVLNKQARYYLCYGKETQKPDYENKKGTIISYDNVPLLNKWRNSLNKYFGDKALNLEVEGNLYYDTKKTGIGFHVDSERKKVIACNIGESRPIHWQWYHNSKPVGERIKVTLNNGDMYIMSEKASGFDWKKRSIKTLRHAAGEKYVK